MKKTLQERLWPKVRKTDTCWLWTAATANGYGYFSVDGKGKRAHRVVYELLVGPIPEGLYLDHLCRVTNCVNPSHLEIVDNRTNTLRGIGITANNFVKAECVKGHLLSGSNVYTRPSRPGTRECRECGKDFHRRRWARIAETIRSERLAQEAANEN